MYETERQNYINHLQAFKDRMEISSEKMASILGISKKTYERFMAGEHIQGEFDLIIRVYELSGKMMYEMTGTKIPQEVENAQVYSLLTDSNKRMVDQMLRIILEEQKRQEKE